jgi:HSP20 family protein
MSDTAVKTNDGNATRQNEAVRPAQVGRRLTYTPLVDVLEQPEGLVLYVDLPGVKSEDVDVRFENRELQIRGKVTPPATKPRYLLNEYGVGDFYRAFSITDDVDAQKISADLKDGVLTVHLPKAEALKQRRITVNA